MTDDAERSIGRAEPSLAEGIAAIRKQLRTLSKGPGVYRMLNAKDEVLYVGKAKNLRSRVASYTRPTGLTNRLARMVAATRAMMIIETETETEALLLEASLIKRLKPRYNIILRDDKSFPYILLRDSHDWPQITKHRGAKSRPGKYFGPFASAGAVNRTLNTLQRIFLLRSCSDSVLESRSRPCLLYQIKRCSAPCVGRISAADYEVLVKEAAAFLEGRNTGLQKRLATKMEAASEKLEYEMAAGYRDRLKALTQIQIQQGDGTDALGDCDVFAMYRDAGQTSVQVFFFRAGQNWGNRSYFPRHERDETDENIMGAFLAQFYDNKPLPKLILTNVIPEGKDLIEEAFTVRAGHRVHLSRPARGMRRKVMAGAEQNAKSALQRRLAERSSQLRHLTVLADILDLDAPPQRIEVFDNSHISGRSALGAMIVADRDGFRKNAYRKFNIRNKELEPGDDYGMMREVLTRRFSRLVKEDPDREGAEWPDLVILDGGRGQLGVAEAVFDELGITGRVPLLAVAKGPDRDAGREHLVAPGRKPFMLEEGNPALYFIQRLRDEAHRFAIGSHRARRQKRMQRSSLDGVPGIGPKRKKALLHYFGSAKAVEGAGVEELAAVEGISRSIATVIYEHFHEHS